MCGHMKAETPRALAVARRFCGLCEAESDSELFLDACYLGVGVGIAAGIVGGVLHLVMYFEVELDFGFCA